MTGLRTLWGRTLAIVVAAVIAAELLTAVLFNALVLLPELNRIARTTAASVAAVADALAEVDPEHRGRLLARLPEAGWLDLRPDTTPPDADGGRPRFLERVFMAALLEALGDRADLVWRTDGRGRLWVHLTIGEDGYWIGVRSLPRLSIVGLFALCALISAALAALVATRLTTGLLSPLAALGRASEALTLSRLPDPLPEVGPDDLARVTRSFNLMTARLRADDARRRTVLAGISHDARTPVTKLRLALALMRPEEPALMASAERQLDVIEHILSQFLTFARGFEAEQVAPVAVEKLLGDLAERFAADGLVVTPPAAGLRAPGRTEALHRALANLVENALRYGAPPVCLEAVARDARVDFVVTDAGPGLDPADVERLRQPFARGDEARTGDRDGTGLGLAIADEVAALHGGHLAFARTAEGFQATLSIPRPAIPAPLGDRRGIAS